MELSKTTWRNLAIIICFLIGVILVATLKKEEFTQTHELYSYTTKNHYVEDLVALELAYQTIAENGKKPKMYHKRFGFSFLLGTECHLVMVVPVDARLRDFTYDLGHEHLHCLAGSWHKENSGKYPAKLTLRGVKLTPQEYFENLKKTTTK